MHTRVADQEEGEYKYEDAEEEEIRRRNTLKDGSMILDADQTKRAYESAAKSGLGGMETGILHTSDMPQSLVTSSQPSHGSSAARSQPPSTPRKSNDADGADADSDNDDVAPQDARLAKMELSAKKAKAKAKAKDAMGGSPSPGGGTLSDKGKGKVNQILADAKEGSDFMKSAESRASSRSKLGLRNSNPW